MKEVIDQYGSFIERGQKYSVLQCRGPVRYRQNLATERRVICYFEGHLNASTNPNAQYGFCITGASVPPGTAEWAREFLSRIEETFQVPNKGIVKGGPGAGHVHWVKWPTPSMLLEPMFVSQPEMAQRISSGEGIDGIARCLADSVIARFPNGGLVGASIGHAHRGTGDGGAPVAKFDLDGDGEIDELDPDFDQEAELVEAYVDSFTQMLTGVKV